ncbi:MAG: helix-turn-helix domain-containing protein [Pseudomonadota bacterium]
MNFKEARTAFEREFIKVKLTEHNGNVTQTAEAIDLDRTSLRKKMKTLGLNGNKD